MHSDSVRPDQANGQAQASVLMYHLQRDICGSPLFSLNSQAEESHTLPEHPMYSIPSADQLSASAHTPLTLLCSTTLDTLHNFLLSRLPRPQPPRTPPRTKVHPFRVQLDNTQFSADLKLNDAIMDHINEASKTNPELKNLLLLAASNNASGEQLRTLGLFVQTLADTFTRDTLGECPMAYISRQPNHCRCGLGVSRKP
jgi:hypothetical protein